MEKSKTERPGSERPLRIPAVDIYEREDGMVLLADMPGVDEKNLEVRVEQGLLTIEGNRPEPPGGRRHIDEMGEGSFYRAFQLSEDLDLNSIQAKLRNGVLRVEIAKSAHLKPKRIPIRTES